MFMLRRVNKMQPSQSGTGIFLIFDSSSFFIETRAFKINHSNEKLRCITLLDDKGASFHLDRKIVISPTHIAGRHVPCMALQLT